MGKLISVTLADLNNFLGLSGLTALDNLDIGRLTAMPDDAVVISEKGTFKLRCYRNGKTLVAEAFKGQDSVRYVTST